MCWLLLFRLFSFLSQPARMAYLADRRNYLAFYMLIIEEQHQWCSVADGGQEHGMGMCVSGWVCVWWIMVGL